MYAKNYNLISHGKYKLVCISLMGIHSFKLILLSNFICTHRSFVIMNGRMVNLHFAASHLAYYLAFFLTDMVRASQYL